MEKDEMLLDFSSKFLLVNKKFKIAVWIRTHLKVKLVDLQSCYDQLVSGLQKKFGHFFLIF